MRKPKRKSSADSLNEEQASILSNKKRKTDNSATATRKRRTSQNQRSLNNSRQPKVKENERGVGKKKVLAEMTKPKKVKMRKPKGNSSADSLNEEQASILSNKKRKTDNSATATRKRTPQNQRSLNNSRQPKVKENERSVGKQKVLAEKDLQEDTQANGMQIHPQVSVTVIDKEVRHFVKVLHSKKQELEGDDSKPRLIQLCASKTESSSNTKGDKNVPSKAAESDPKFKLVREMMYS